MAAAIVGLVAFSVIGAYIYYPDLARCHEEMATIKAEAFSATAGGRADGAIRHFEQWDLTVRKLEVGECIRTLGVTAEQAKSAEDLREALEEVRDKLLAGDVPAARKATLADLEKEFRAVKAAYPRPPKGSGSE